MKLFRHLRLRFSIRALLVSIAAAAIFLAYHVHWIVQRREFFRTQTVAAFEARAAPATPAPGLLALFGERGFTQIAMNSNLPKAEYARVMSYFPEAALADFCFYNEPIIE
ncbi:hypothetical protein I41_25780 [Lacipirellula limnantheis]|uniref:Uncharacterized protein n=1 Tax=Lacipirellula limnantheis TaxID=2528024 RepID=A0A517TYE2_9BACT|nr:hypothetical protein I41_25780 [Lacipirellula limnantheis]